MDTKAIYNYFSDILCDDPEKMAVLGALMDINGDTQWIIDFIDYYGFDIDELDEDIQELYNEN